MLKIIIILIGLALGIAITMGLVAVPMAFLISHLEEKGSLKKLKSILKKDCQN